MRESSVRMNLLHVADLGEGHIQLSWHRGNDIPRQYPQPVSFTDPLRAKDRSKLRWYLEDYLQFPYGAERYRAEQAEREMGEWGESLFKQVFVKGEEDPDPRAFYQEAVREGLEKCELCITSEDPAFLNIPWELMRDPTPGRGYLAPSLAGLYRQHTGHRIEAPLEVSSEAPFRILLVIARPYGERDIPLGTVARPVLEALRPLRPRVELEVLRPPTFDALVKRLNARRGFYNLIHFDGHGVFARRSGRGLALMFGAMEGRGHLVFEKEDGTPHVVNSPDLAQALATCRVPLFVLNACQSSEEGQEDAFSSVASQLVAIGAKGVVAMSYSVYATSASRFMQRFYENVVGHASLSEAVAAARQRLYTEPDHESIVGTLELRDWMVPTLYQQEYRFVPIPEGAGAAAAEEEEQEAVLRQRAEEVCPEGRFGFIGRDYDILCIERALRQDRQPWVLLTGLGGIGKTELAFGFARWYAETGGCPGGVFATSFKEKADFGQVIGSIVGYGTDFSRLPEEEQWERLLGYLRSNPCLLIWDNFESVAGYPEGAEPLATKEERDELSRFLKALRGGKSRVLITTRKPDEDWLRIAYKLVEMIGLTDRDAGQLAKVILGTVGRRPEDFRDDPEYAELLKLLKGHPRSQEVVLPHLRTRTPHEVIEALQHRIDSLGEALEDASLGYAFSLMSSRTQRHLPFIGLFASYLHVGTLASFVGAGAGQQQVYAEIIGEALDAEGWEAVLDEAGRSGLLRPRGSRVYDLHPTLPPFLRRQLVSMVGEDGLRRLDAEFMKFYAVWAAHVFQDVETGSRNAVAAVALEEANFLRALRLAVMNRHWKITQVIAQMIKEFYEIHTRTDEWNALRSHLLRRVGREIADDSPRDQADLSMYLLGEEANQALERNDLSIADDIIHRILNYLTALNDADTQPRIAVVYHQLGRIAEERQQFDEAEQWYHKALEIRERLRLEQYVAYEYHQLGVLAQKCEQLDQAEKWYNKALEIRERLGLERYVAYGYHQLGRIAEERQQFDQAEQWYRKALRILERLRLERDAVASYHQLGMISQERQQFDQAEQWYRKALQIRERLGLERDAASDYHQLGMISQEWQQFDQAEQWYRKALQIRERLGLERDAASDYHQLGRIAEERQQFDEAEQWYDKALEIRKRLGLEREVAFTYHQLGRIAEDRQQLGQAEEWYHEALGIKERLGHPPLMVSTLAQLGVLHRRQNHLQETVAWSGRALFIATRYNMRVAGQILADLARVMKAMGEEEFAGAWRQAFEGQEPPLEAIRKAAGKPGAEAPG